MKEKGKKRLEEISQDEREKNREREREREREKEEKQYFTRARATWPDATVAAKSSVLRTPFAGKFNVSGFGRRNSEIEK